MDANNIALLSLIVIFVLILYLFIDIKSKIDSFLKKKDGDIIRDLSLMVGLLFLLYSILSPFISKFFFPFEKLENHKILPLDANELGDALGGTMGPFIAIAGVIFTFLAFYIQKIANDEIKEQFKKQQFEAQFYEMLKLHKENVNELELSAKKRYVAENFISPTGEYYKYEGYKVTKRRVFYELNKEFEYILDCLKRSDLTTINEVNFYKAYNIFFWGLKGYDNLASRFVLGSTKFEDILFYNQNIQYSKTLFSFNEIIKFDIEAFKGHSDFLGHYYRHLFHTVKFVVYSPILKKREEKLNYLRLLRAQLSNHEQIMLFYNWIGSGGKEWENNDNHFLTEYKMIHNLWYDNLPDEDYFKCKLLYLVETYQKQGHKDDLFESGDKEILDNYKKFEQEGKCQ